MVIPIRGQENSNPTTRGPKAGRHVRGIWFLFASSYTPIETVVPWSEWILQDVLTFPEGLDFHVFVCIICVSGGYQDLLPGSYLVLPLISPGCPGFKREKLPGTFQKPNGQTYKNPTETPFTPCSMHSLFGDLFREFGRGILGNARDYLGMEVGRFLEQA